MRAANTTSCGAFRELPTVAWINEPVPVEEIASRLIRRCLKSLDRFRQHGVEQCLLVLIELHRRDPCMSDVKPPASIGGDEEDEAGRARHPRAQ